MRIADRDGTWQGELRPIRAVIRQEINGEYSAEIELAERSEFFVRDAIVELPDANGTMQLFRLESPTTTLDTVTAFAWHISQDLAHDQIVNRGWESRTGAYVWPELITAGIEPARFSGTSDISTVNSLRIVRQSVLAAAIGDRDNSFVNRFGGELRRDNFTVDCLARIGRQTGYRIEYRKNLLGFEAAADDSELVNRVIPTYLNAAEAAVQLPETYIDSPRISATAIPHSRAIYFSEIQVGREDDDGYVPYPTDADAQQAVRDAVQAMWYAGADTPAVSVKVNFLELRNTREYEAYRELETLELGDSVDLLYDQWTIRERMIAYVWDALEKEYTEITLGVLQPSMDALTARIQTEASNAAEDAVKSVFVPSTVKAMAQLTQGLAQASGYYQTIVYDADGSRKVYNHDKPRLEDSLRIEYAPEAGSRFYTDSGWNDGSPVWKAGDADGKLIRDMIYVNKLDAGAITAGGVMLTEYFGGLQEADRVQGANVLLQEWTDEETVYGMDRAILLGFTAPSITREGDQLVLTADVLNTSSVYAVGLEFVITDMQGTQHRFGSGDASYATDEEAKRLIAYITVPAEPNSVSIELLASNPHESFSAIVSQMKLEFGAYATAYTRPVVLDRGDYNRTKAKLEVVDDTLVTTVNSMQALMDTQLYMQQTQESWQLVVQQIQQTTGENEVTLGQVQNWLNFGASGLELGKSDSDLILQLRNDRISFLDGGAEVAWITGQQLYIRSMVVMDSANIINHRFERLDDDHTLVNWVGPYQPDGIG